MRRAASQPKAKASAVQARGACLCGAVQIEIDVPARWAWHDHAARSRLAHGAAYVTYVGSYRSRFRILEGAGQLTRFEDVHAGVSRSFCSRCGAPMIYERTRSPTMVNIPRAVFTERTGREPRYHMNLNEQADWIYLGEPLAPLKGYPGVMWERPKRKKSPRVLDAMFEP